MDEIIDVHLQTCDELLILLSPSSVKSSWVLVEIGGAKALGKRIVPILLHLGANDIPSPISKNVALDLNNIEQYYRQAKARSQGKPTPVTRQRRKIGNIRPGDKVRIVAVRPPKYKTSKIFVDWEAKDDHLLGKEATVIYVDEDGTFKIDIDAGESWLAPTWVTKVETSK